MCDCSVVMVSAHRPGSCNIVMITARLIMMINKMLSHWKIARCARASQLYHRGPPLKLRPKTWDSSLDDGRLPARARPIQTVRCNYRGPRTLVHNDTQNYFSKWNVSINSARNAVYNFNLFWVHCTFSLLLFLTGWLLRVIAEVNRK